MVRIKKPNEGLGQRSYKPSSARDHVFDSSGPDGKIRGTAKQLVDKYVNLGRDAMSIGDRVITESFFQHAEHYRRIVLEKEGNAATFNTHYKKKQNFSQHPNDPPENEETDSNALEAEEPDPIHKA